MDRLIGVRLIYIRRAEDLSQKKMADALGLTLAQMANVESGRVSLRLFNAWTFCWKFMVNPYWLATGMGSVSLDWLPKEECLLVEKFIRKKPEALFRDTYDVLIQAVVEASHKIDLTNKTTYGKKDGVKNQWQKLKRKIQKAVSKPGSKSTLAKFLGVDLTQLSKWLTDSKAAREPGAEYTLQMLHWVEHQERQK
jgi:DNA-binding XRE family transcriptional regulator